MPRNCSKSLFQWHSVLHTFGLSHQCIIRPISVKNSSSLGRGKMRDWLSRGTAQSQSPPDRQLAAHLTVSSVRGRQSSEPVLPTLHIQVPALYQW